MESYVTGAAVKALREARGLTQRQLAEKLSVSDKAVSKWETGRGLPDITLLEPLAAALGVSLAELLSGRQVTNLNRSGNLLRSAFYVCPICGNVLFAAGAGVFSCCGLQLPPLEPEEEDGEHTLLVQRLDGEHYVSLDHPMTRDHYLSFLAYVTTDGLQLRRLYPEQAAEAYFPIRGTGWLYGYCNRHGLFRRKL